MSSCQRQTIIYNSHLLAPSLVPLLSRTSWNLATNKHPFFTLTCPLTANTDWTPLLAIRAACFTTLLTTFLTSLTIRLTSFTLACFHQLREHLLPDTRDLHPASHTRRNQRTHLELDTCTVPLLQ